MAPIIIATFACSGTALLGVVAYLASVDAELRQSHKESSRFPLFAARDALIALIGEEKMEETDLAWRTMYAGINHMLCMENEWHALDCLLKYAKFSAQMDADPSLKHQLKLVMKREQEAAAKVPEFAAVRQRVDAAFKHLVHRRTTSFHTTVILTLKLAALAFTKSFGTANLARKRIKRSSGASYRGWLATRPDDLPIAA